MTDETVIRSSKENPFKALAKEFLKENPDMTVGDAVYIKTFAMWLDRRTLETFVQRIGPTDPDNDMVICPHCTSQFVAVPVNVQKLLAAPEAIPCECTTYCLHSGYPDAPLRRGVFCREKANAQKANSGDSFPEKE